MAAYCYIDIIKIHDEQALNAYREKVLDTVNRHQGRYVVIGGPCEQKEGNWRPVYPVIIEFPTLEHAQCWYDSEAYNHIKNLRQEASISNAVIIQGI